MAEDFVGRGLGYPLSFDTTGRVALVGGQDELEQSMRIILATAPGERPMRPDFGCGIHDFVFTPTNSTTTGRIAHEVKAALSRWETRVEVSEVKVETDPEWDGTLFIVVQYAERGNNDVRNLVFPFYLIPPHDGDEEIAMLPPPDTAFPAISA